ncbi:HAMP domain-containing sensor histidine kinase [Geodermatophilus sp. DSM 44513]|uniref:sensor histidine kinase n=1 Tax=Geodermatophilus sp. DSM 44513 TaxID=1528104 RepID=UPI0012837963|nr:HAMP domain-containing sensor histidine kinase [Geodermatophilus sp. DSM 44513]WNV77670.1 HAMP domain-containing sensor histidine kinase [Geodermatophilus sp. DSM 44513]
MTATRSRREPFRPADAQPDVGAALPRSPRAPLPRTLRGRATLAFTVVTVVVCGVLTVAVWVAVSQYLLLQRERTTLLQTTDNAAQVERALTTEGLPVPQVLAQLPRESGSVSLFVDDGAWQTTSLLLGRDDVPTELAETVLGGTPARQRIAVEGTTVMAVGIPFPGADRAYFEVFPLTELDRTYRVLSTVLALAIAGLVPLLLVIGWWVTGPALRPLHRVAAAAEAIAGGDLSARIDPRGDPSLVPIASSFNRTAAALETRVRADARFAADVSHELRSPLTAMMGAVDLVEGAADGLAPDGREALTLLRDEVLRFERLVADLLEISRADAGSADLAVEEVRLAALVREALTRRRLAGRPTARLEVPAEAAEVVIRADKRRLERVLNNLMDNADAHGGGLTGITVTCSGDTACVLVDDDGPGIPPAERNRVLERFARGSGSTRTRTEGAGLGLALVARHVQAMGGTVTVHDSPSGGARFVVGLPLHPVP